MAQLPQPPAAAHVLSMVFISTARHLLGIPPPTTKDHAYPIRYSTGHRGSILAKLGFPPTALQIPKSQHTPKPKTMLSRCAANGLPAWSPAAFVLSMVFSLWARQLLGFRTMDPQTPCLEDMEPSRTRNPTYIIAHNIKTWIHPLTCSRNTSYNLDVGSCIASMCNLPRRNLAQCEVDVLLQSTTMCGNCLF